MIKEAQTIHLFRQEHDDDIADCVRYFNLEQSNAAALGTLPQGDHLLKVGTHKEIRVQHRPHRPGDRLHRNRFRDGHAAPPPDRGGPDDADTDRDRLGRSRTSSAGLLTARQAVIALVAAAGGRGCCWRGTSPWSSPPVSRSPASGSRCAA